jgi:hypothetical protein
MSAFFNFYPCFSARFVQARIRLGSAFDRPRFNSAGAIGHPYFGNEHKQFLLLICEDISCFLFFLPKGRDRAVPIPRLVGQILQGLVITFVPEGRRAPHAGGLSRIRMRAVRS